MKYRKVIILLIFIFFPISTLASAEVKKTEIPQRCDVYYGYKSSTEKIVLEVVDPDQKNNVTVIIDDGDAKIFHRELLEGKWKNRHYVSPELRKAAFIIHAIQNKTDAKYPERSWTRYRLFRCHTDSSKHGWIREPITEPVPMWFYHDNTDNESQDS